MGIQHTYLKADPVTSPLLYKPILLVPCTHNNEAFSRPIKNVFPRLIFFSVVNVFSQIQGVSTSSYSMCLSMYHKALFLCHEKIVFSPATVLSKGAVSVR